MVSPYLNQTKYVRLSIIILLMFCQNLVKYLPVLDNQNRFDNYLTTDNTQHLHNFTYNKQIR